MNADTKNYDANIAKARKQLEGFKKDNLSLGGILKQGTASIMSYAASFASVTAAIGAVTSAIADNIQTARGFEKSMSQLSSLTGMAGKDLERLKEYAIQLGASTTLSASQVADAFKMIGSQQPQLLASGEALRDVTRQAITLSEAAGIDLAAAAQTLSTSINQMGGDSNNATRYVNVLAAASQKGAGDIAWLGEAITKSGTTAKAVGTDYEELVANLEQLAKAGFDASTAGTALRSIIMNLEKQANNNFKPSVVGLTTAFENLGKANLSVVQYQDIVGKMFASQAMALADAAKEARNMTEAITGTNTAEEQARINTTNLDGALKSLSSAWEGLNLHINSSNGPLTAFINNLTATIRKADATVVVMKTLWRYLTGDLKPEEEGGSGGGSGTVNTNSITEIPEIVVSGNAPKKTRKTKGSSVQLTEEQMNTRSIDKLTQEYIKASAERQAAIRQEIKVLQDRNAELKMLADEAQGKISPANISEANGVLLGDTMSSPVEKYKNTLISIKSPLQALTEEMERLAEAQAKAMSPEQWQAYQKQIEQIQKKMGKFKGEGKGSQESWHAAAQAIGQVGSAVSSLEDPAAKVAGTIAQAIASVALGYAQATKEAATLGPWAWVAFAASGMAQMISMISAIHSSTGYAQGGIVKGTSYSGDNIPANGGTIGLDAGELVLTRAMQGNLASQLQPSGGGGGGGVQVARISGEQIYVALNRHLKRSGQGELVTWG
jgi:TP901 family phage tail tape measure protein